MVETTTLTESSESDTDSEESVSEKILNFRYLSHPDFLLLSSAPPGYFSFRNPAGSWMVQELYEVFSHHTADKDFLQIFTKTNRLVAKRVSRNKDEPDIDDKKLTLCLTSTLTRNLDFRSFN
ncbi:hypothetical protein JTE90_029691 [Oedothorax gibbosus]|uniref:Caspase family p10 domain-containing protein n=1 Tax=Oedothorax gibbosus TaxID=931172 RepID=A0AAV6TND7_9ARAC|nr:hypothetical protein JTE90_029691 [Oedothorax gibbosus]